MPWTEAQVRYLLSSVSPLSEKQKAKMRKELKSPGMILPQANALTIKPDKERSK